MKKNIWIFNHYATNMYFDNGGRHFWIAKELKKRGYQPTIFCASIDHIANNKVNMESKEYLRRKTDEIPFVFVSTPGYSGNNKNRIRNMISFYRGLKKNYKNFIKLYGKPDLILASSVHPLTLIAGIQISRTIGIPCISEIRDLWPESLVAYGYLNAKSILAKILYMGEKWIYKNSDAIVMTWEGGKEYIYDQGWSNQIDTNKIHHISNGIIISDFVDNSKKYEIKDEDLAKSGYVKVVYTGSIRAVNNIGILLDTAKLVEKSNKKITFLIYGSGEELNMLEQRCFDENINNVIFKGRVEKKFIPSILMNSDINILHNSSTSLDKYGQSQNKLFEYLAAGTCIIQTYTTGFNVLEKNDAGIMVNNQTAQEIAQTILRVSEDKLLRIEKGKKAQQIANNFDFEILTSNLVKIIESL